MICVCFFEISSISDLIFEFPSTHLIIQLLSKFVTSEIADTTTTHLVSFLTMSIILLMQKSSAIEVPPNFRILI